MVEFWVEIRFVAANIDVVAIVVVFVIITTVVVFHFYFDSLRVSLCVCVVF